MNSAASSSPSLSEGDAPNQERTARRRRAALLFAILIGLASLLGIDYLRNRDDAAVRTIAGPIERSLNSLFGDRSPGARLALLQSKFLGERSGERGGPSQRALGKTFPPQGQTPFFFPGDIPIDVVSPPQIPGTLPLPDELSFAPPGGGGFPPFPGFPGNPGGYFPPEAGLTPPPPPLVPPIPEPATWLTMLIGFGTVGWVIRRARKRALKQA